MPGIPGRERDLPVRTGDSVFKVEGKLFAISALAASPLKVSLKCEPDLAEQLRAAHEAIAPATT